MASTSNPEPRPKTWLITSALSPLGHAISVAALSRGDNVCAGCTRSEIAPQHVSTTSRQALLELKSLGGERCIIVELDTRNIALCQSAVATTVHNFRSLDVLLNLSALTYVAPLENISPSSVLAQFETSYFGPTNTMRAALPCFRHQRRGHIINITGTTGAMGTPGLAVRCAGDHATEGLSDALAFEVAPFGVRVTIVQPGVEVAVMAAPIILGDAGEAYESAGHPYATFQDVIAGVLELGLDDENVSADSQMPEVPEGTLDETVSIVTAIAGIENPPGRIVIGAEAVEQVKERLKTVSEELEEYLDASLGADIITPTKEPGGRRGSSVREDVVML